VKLNYTTIGKKIYYLVNPASWKEQAVWDLWERLSSRDRFNSRLPATSSAESEAAPTGVFFNNLDLPQKRIS